MIIQNELGHILLVRHSYVDPETWMLPGGMMSSREFPRSAAERELHEEVACPLAGSRLIEFEDAHYWGMRYRNYIVGGFTDRTPTPDLREINEASFFSLTDLPRDISEPTVERLERWQKRNSLPVPVPPFVRVDYAEKRFRPPA